LAIEVVFVVVVVDDDGDEIWRLELYLFLLLMILKFGD
jgi:hypothetical protein